MLSVMAFTREFPPVYSAIFVLPYTSRFPSHFSTSCNSNSCPSISKYCLPGYNCYICVACCQLHSSYFVYYISAGILLHPARSFTQVRDDGSMPKPSLLERYFHRPLHVSFDDVDIVSYHSTYSMSSSPPAYAHDELWHETPWDNTEHALFVFKRRATAKVNSAESYFFVIFPCLLLHVRAPP